MGWYNSYSSDNPLSQGVILFDFPLPELDTIKQPVEGMDAQIEFNPYDVIVLTQTCDLTNKRVDRVFLCPVYTLKDHFIAHPSEAVNKKTVVKEYEKLKSGRLVNKFLLNECHLINAKHLKDNFLVVIFNQGVVVSMDYVEEFLHKSRRKNFIALNPPYREALAQHYGRYFMRVGNPIDYPSEDEFKYQQFVTPT